MTAAGKRRRLYGIRVIGVSQKADSLGLGEGRSASIWKLRKGETGHCRARLTQRLVHQPTELFSDAAQSLY